MTEIRPIVENEAEEFLDLLCSTFNLDSARARGIFFTEPLFDLSRKWALFDGKQIVSILTTTPLQFGWGKAYGVAGVATREDRRREGHAAKLLDHVHKESIKRGENGALLFAKDDSLYHRCGFESLDVAVRGHVVPAEPSTKKVTPLENGAVEAMYNRWASEHPDRLRRDSKRWAYWHWNYRICEPFDGGYICNEPTTLRETIFKTPQYALPVNEPTEWFGTKTMAESLGIPFLGQPKTDLHLMGKQIPTPPQMFMTDQF